MAIPKRVLQIRTETCWAACMECWTREAYYYRPVNQMALANQYGENENGGLNAEGSKINDFCNEFWLDRLIVPAGQLTADRVKRWLDYPGYFMVVGQTGAKSSHAMLIFDYDDGVLWGMDPDASMFYPVKIGMQNLPLVLAFYLNIKKVPSF